MIQLKIAFLDEEELYLEQLKGYFVQKKENFFKIYTFTDADSFLKSRITEQFDAVVMTYPFWEMMKEQDFSEKKILLSEEDGYAAEGCLHVDKYQSAEKLSAKIASYIWQENREGKEVFLNTAELIGIYSPVSHEDQMLFSMTMAQILAADQKVLYVNLMENSGFYELLHTEATADIGDLFYTMMHEDHDFSLYLHSILKTCRNFDYIPPAVNPEHLSEISQSLYEKFFIALKNNSGYDVVIVDFGRIFLGFAELIPLFSNFYCLKKEGRLNHCRMDAFLTYLQKKSMDTVEKMHSLHLLERQAGAEENLLEADLYGTMGDYIRRTLYGGAVIDG